MEVSAFQNIATQKTAATDTLVKTKKIFNSFLYG
jgi:hypothetical protein